MANFSFPTTETQLELLKAYIKSNLKDTQHIVSTVKAGLIDIRDELPTVMILPLFENVSAIYNGGLFSIDRDYRIDIVHSAYKIEDVRSGLKTKLAALKALWTMENQNWQLRDSGGLITCCNFKLDNETIGEPTNVENQYTQYATLPIKLSSYYQATDIVVPIVQTESNLIEVLDYLFSQTSNFTAFIERWKDVVLPISITRYPAIGVFVQNSQEDKETTSSEEDNDVTFVLRVYSSLATKEIAFINHLRNVETVKAWILRNPQLDGRVMDCSLSSIDYGIQNLTRPTQGGIVEEVPVFRSDITVTTKIFNFT